MQNRTRLLAEEILSLESNRKEVKELGHNKEEVRHFDLFYWFNLAFFQIDELYRNTVKVKQTMTDLNKFVERLEQKRKMHDLSAKILLDVSSLEE